MTNQLFIIWAVSLADAFLTHRNEVFIAAVIATLVVGVTEMHKNYYARND